MLAFLSILYNPDENAIKNIQAAKQLGIYPIVYQNEIDSSYEKRLKDLDIALLGSNKNIGLGMAFKEAEDFMQHNTIEHYIYFDQDTIVPVEAWLHIRDSYQSHFKEENIGMLFYGNSKINPMLVVSSGSLFSMTVIKKLGSHDGSFFVEGVDYEICLRLKASNYKIKNIPVNSIDHLSLQDNDQKKLFGITFNIRCYGRQRWKDFNLSHSKLLMKSLHLQEYKMFILFMKSFIIFNAREVYSRLLMVLV